MKTYFADQDISVTIPLTRDGEPFVADGLIKWSLRDQTGALIQLPTNTTSTNSMVTVLVPAALGSINPDRLFEKRTLTLSGFVSGEIFTVTQTYRLSPFINMTASPSDVRAYIGCDDGELPDSDIDMFNAYFAVVDTAGRDTINTALSTGTSQELQANQAIIAQAILNCLPSLQARISKTTNDGTISITRFNLNFDELRASARDKLDRALNTILGRDTSTRLVFVVGTRTDPITGS